jgi:hypothetical protein
MSRDEAELALRLAWCAADPPDGVDTTWDHVTDDPSDDPASGFPACKDPDWDAALTLDSAELVPWPTDGPVETVVLRTPADPFRDLDSRVEAWVETVMALAAEVDAALS